ncbi:predicted protein [Uncinocarpus reesii 1704]|uniref:Arf-GAP domain-containing protein n=1 Tax=Uncinocarpus reesii (strain UAMH 1704) TaxID=336963 RepID=C4JEU5_UNCRE|nr:uncharacterized protein UREG_02255 [Uncinocarpus reesii 1704]EEP77406.1 predicted protein [Uncinocarpus reesii 1704]
MAQWEERRISSQIVDNKNAAQHSGRNRSSSSESACSQLCLRGRRAVDIALGFSRTGQPSTVSLGLKPKSIFSGDYLPSRQPHQLPHTVISIARLAEQEMPSALSKRQQARHERTLQELINTVPGNDRCADCQARNPGWASWNLGVFLCMRCAALHRKLGTHISKVKSLSMDSWSQDQVDTMKSNGNATVNKIYNPKNIKPPIPIDADEVDSAMERFIRQKYESKILEDGRPKIPSREDPSYIGKPTEESPPPLPPKPSRRFGFGLRSSSSHSGSNKSSPRRESFGSISQGSLHNNKPSRALGFSLSDSNSSFESKLAMLRNMGFPDDKRNATILRGLNGDVEKTVDALAPLPRSRTPTLKTPTSTKSSEPYERSTPLNSNNPFDKMGTSSSRGSAGISINRRESQSTTASTDEVSSRKPTSYNPFDVPPAQHAPAPTLEQSFQNLQVSQPLFPNMTGGYPSQSGQAAYLKYQQPMTPPVTMTSQNVFAGSPAPLNGSYNPFFQSPSTFDSATSAPQQPSLSPTNPYFAHAASQDSRQSQLLNSLQPAATSSAPEIFHLQHANTMPMLPTLSFTTPQQHHQQQHPQFPQSAPITPVHSTSFFQPQYTQQPSQYFQPPQPTRMDKSSILALYNFSKPPPTILEQPQPQTQPEPPSSQVQAVQQPVNPLPFPPDNPTATTSQIPDASPAGSRNPFFTSMNTNIIPTNPSSATSARAQPRSTPFARAHMSQESVDIGRAQSGRHSPDVFASLSARYG